MAGSFANKSEPLGFTKGTNFHDGPYDYWLLEECSIALTDTIQIKLYQSLGLS
jgi:hypothetical protein